MTATAAELDGLLEPVGDLIGAASQLLQETWQAGPVVHHKGPADLVTDTDLAVQRFLVPRLVSLWPNSVVLAEEEGQVPTAIGQPCWVVDPVDGTSNLVHGVRYVAISVAFTDGLAPLVGWVQDVFGNHLYTARRGRGAWVDGARLTGSAATSLADALVACGTPYDKKAAADVFAPLARVWRACHALRVPGAAALELAQVAEGRLDAFFEIDLQPWDFAAGWLLVTESGGLVTDWNGGPRTLHRGSIVAAAPPIHRPLLELLAPAAAKDHHLNGPN